jgi:hypothetical protein
MNKKETCKNCGDHIADDRNSNEFCSEQCGVEYRLEHNKNKIDHNCDEVPGRLLSLIGVRRSDP